MPLKQKVREFLEGRFKKPLLVNKKCGKRPGVVVICTAYMR
jgi:hypothetical protein